MEVEPGEIEAARWVRRAAEAAQAVKEAGAVELGVGGAKEVAREEAETTARSIPRSR